MKKTTVNGGDGKVRFQTDPATGKMMLWQGDNVATFDLPQARGGDGAFLPVSTPEEDASLARIFRMDVRAQQKFPPFSPCVIEGPTSNFECQIKNLTNLDMMQAGVLMSSRGYALTDLTTAQARAVLFAALFVVAIVQSEATHQRCFDSLQEAEAWLNEPGMVWFSDQLLGWILTINKDVKKITFRWTTNRLYPQPNSSSFPSGSTA